MLKMIAHRKHPDVLAAPFPKAAGHGAWSSSGGEGLK
jgi:hypothetical protein